MPGGGLWGGKPEPTSLLIFLSLPFLCYLFSNQPLSWCVKREAGYSYHMSLFSADSPLLPGTVTSASSNEGDMCLRCIAVSRLSA